MITGKSPTRREWAKVAIRCFLEQTHSEKELVIINDGRVPVGSSDPQVRELMIPHSPNVSLGELRNIGLQQARGEFVIQWDDDDWHHPRRIELQLSCWEKGAAVLLQKQIRYNFLDGEAIVYNRLSGIHGTILHEKLEGVRYLNRSKREDSWFLINFSHRKILNCCPPLYIRFCHGANTWNPRHIMLGSKLRCFRNRPKLSPREQELMNFVLLHYYGSRNYSKGLDAP
jgi:glycosyltransferase involved in cell wall biosynthesis